MTTTHRAGTETKTFDAWLRRTVRIVQVFTVQAMHALMENPPLFRVVPGGCRERHIAEARDALASYLRVLRKAGIDRREVRRLALCVIDAPHSCAGRAQVESCARVRWEIAEYALALLPNRDFAVSEEQRRLIDFLNGLRVDTDN